MDDARVIRAEYFCALGDLMELTHPAFGKCRSNALKLIKAGRLMTCAMYMYQKRLFMYVESLDEDVDPDEIALPLKPFIRPQPFGGEEERGWIKMIPVFWHAEPQGAASWREGRPRQRRRGRIAFLKPDKLTEYVYHHRALTDEGVFRGDKYMFISLWGDLLFSYFEEPRSSDNARGADGESRAIKGWIDTDPDSHFIHLEGSNGQNFLLIDACFDVGETDA